MKPTVEFPVSVRVGDDLTPWIASKVALRDVTAVDAEGGTADYVTADGTVSIAVVEGRVWGVTAFESARVDDQELIGRTRREVGQLFGFPDRTDPITAEWIYADGERRLEVYFGDDDVVSFVTDVDDTIFPSAWG